MGWQKYYIEPRAQQAAALTAANTAAPSTAAQATPPGTTPSLPNTLPKKPPQTLVIKTRAGEATIGDGAQYFANWHLNNYKLSLSSEAAPVDMGSVTNQDGSIELTFDSSMYSYLNTVQGTLTSTSSGALWSFEDANAKMTRTFTASENLPYIDVVTAVEFKSKPPTNAFFFLSGRGYKDDPKAQDRQLFYYSNRSLEKIKLKDTVEQKEIPTNLKYIGAGDRYFILALISEGAVEPRGLLQPAPNGVARINLAYAITGNQINIPSRVYFGPKDLDILKSVEPVLADTVDFGYFTIFAIPILNVLHWLYGMVHNYGVAIILLTILLKIITFPLTYKSVKSMKEMAKIQPQLAKLREKYKDDKESLNKEMLTLMREHGYNPAAGCLPMLIQMPIFFALYRALYSSIELLHAPFAVWIQDLSSPDRFYVTPVLLAGTMFFQQKLTPNTATDPAQQKMLQFMPLIFGAFMLTLPSGLTLYMLTNAITSIAQQMFLNKKLS
jgi:YidC/Oxa1 family membrane protein insertase